MNTNLFFDLMNRLFSTLAAIREYSCSFVAENTFYIDDQAEFSISRSASTHGRDVGDVDVWKLFGF